MPQIRVLEPKDTDRKDLLTKFGFTWCTKDGRWEKNGRMVRGDIVDMLRKEGLSVEHDGKVNNYGRQLIKNNE